MPEDVQHLRTIGLLCWPVEGRKFHFLGYRLPLSRFSVCCMLWCLINNSSWEHNFSPYCLCCWIRTRLVQTELAFSRDFRMMIRNRAFEALNFCYIVSVFLYCLSAIVTISSQHSTSLQIQMVWDTTWWCSRCEYHTFSEQYTKKLYPFRSLHSSSDLAEAGKVWDRQEILIKIGELELTRRSVMLSRICWPWSRRKSKKKHNGEATERVVNKKFILVKMNTLVFHVMSSHKILGEDGIRAGAQKEERLRRTTTKQRALTMKIMFLVRCRSFAYSAHQYALSQFAELSIHSSISSSSKPRE